MFEVNNVVNQLKNIKINGCHLPMQLDAGAAVSLVSRMMWEKLGSSKLSRVHNRLEVYDSHIMTTLGKLQVTLELDNKYMVADLIVVETNKHFGLIGRDNLSGDDLSLIQHVSNSSSTILPSIKRVTAMMELI